MPLRRKAVALNPDDGALAASHLETCASPSRYYEIWWFLPRHGESPSRHGFKYYVTVIHDSDALGYPHDLGNLHFFVE